ncbi:MAG: hypothetical protein GY849_19150, partial [Deltaproteobacteria bacterium]|nr:hypothetical protein [Deltaproteobacteria bacterium]
MKIKKPAIMVLLLAFGALALPFGANAVVDWTKYASNPVLTPGGAGTWDEEDLDRPALIKDGATYKMWYVGGNNTVEQIGYATSADGINWTKYGSNPVLTPSGAGWDSTNVGYCWVIKDGATYKMWYSGSDNTIDPEEDSQIGYATSSDGVTWVKHGSNPVLPKGGANDWDGDTVQWPSVIKDGGTYKMWYAAWNDAQGTDAIGYATSTDGITWTKYNDPSTTTNPYANSDP